MLSDEYIAILRSRTPHLPSLSCVYSTNSDDIASRADYRYGSKTNNEMECIAKFISLTDVTYLEALESLATDSRVLRTPSGGRTTSGGTLYDLLIPLRTLRHWVSSKSVDKWENLNVEHVFTPHHWYELLRVVSMVYDQERAYTDGDGDTVFLAQERFFGPGCQELDCDLWALYNMFLICQGAVDPEKYERFKQYEDTDSSSSRLADLSATYRRRFANYDRDDEYYTDNDSSDRLFHVLPLHPAGLSQPTEDNRREWRRGWHDIRPYDTSPHTRMVYIRDYDTVEVKVNEYFVTMSTTPIPFSFFEEFGVMLMLRAACAFCDDGSESRLNELIENVNDGNYHAGRFLFSHVFNLRIVAAPGPYSSWFPYTHVNGEVITESINLQALVDVVGDLLITDDNEIILPVSCEDQLCYLTSVKRRRSTDFYAEWRDTYSTIVRAKRFSEFEPGAQLLGGEAHRMGQSTPVFPPNAALEFSATDAFRDTRETPLLMSQFNPGVQLLGDEAHRVGKSTPILPQNTALNCFAKEAFRATRQTPLCYFDGDGKVSTMFSSPSGGAEELFFFDLANRLSRMRHFDNTEVEYLPSNYRHKHDECSKEWEEMLSVTQSTWSSLTCSNNENKWNVETHNGRFLCQKKKSEFFILFMCDFFMAFDDESDLLLIIVPLSKAIVLAPVQLSMNRLLAEVAPVQVHFIARRLVQLTALSWQFDCLANLERNLPEAERLTPVSRIFHGMSVDLGPTSLDILTGCKVGLGDWKGGYIVGLDLCGATLGLSAGTSGVAYPKQLHDVPIIFDESITDYIEMTIGGTHFSTEEPPLERMPVCRPVDEELNLSFVPKNLEFERLRSESYRHPKDLEEAFLRLGYGKQFSAVLRCMATTHFYLKGKLLTLESVQAALLQHWWNITHRTSRPITFNIARGGILPSKTPFLVRKDRKLHVVTSPRIIEKTMTGGMNIAPVSVEFGRTSSKPEFLICGVVENLHDAVEQLSGSETHFNLAAGGQSWFKVHKRGMSDILGALTLLSIMLTGKVQPTGEFMGCVPEERRAYPDQPVDFNIPVPYGLAYASFASGYEPDDSVEIAPEPVLYSIGHNKWNLACDYTYPAVLAEPANRAAVEHALFAEDLEPKPAESREISLISGARQIIQRIQVRPRRIRGEADHSASATVRRST